MRFIVLKTFLLLCYEDCSHTSFSMFLVNDIFLVVIYFRATERKLLSPLVLSLVIFGVQSSPRRLDSGLVTGHLTKLSSSSSNSVSGILKCRQLLDGSEPQTQTL